MRFSIVQNVLFSIVVVLLTISGTMKVSSALAMGLISLYFASVGGQLSSAITKDEMGKYGRYNQRDLKGWIWTLVILTGIVIFSIRGQM